MVEQEVERRLFQVSLYYCYCVELIDEVRIWAEFCSYCESNSGQKKNPITTWVFPGMRSGFSCLHCVQKTDDSWIHITKQLTSDNTDYICK
jgi:hypothetical protein